ncbi:MAG: DNA translocase FtsK, partial [Acholeplasmatales bacterium]|nr:DNA translocase FtsK [Acholeplasmatales bacterium]
DAPEEVDYTNEDAEFKLNINIDFNDDEADTYEYNTYDKRMEAPVQANIPSFLTSKDDSYVERPVEEKVVELQFGTDDDDSYVEEETYSNPPVDKNLTIEEAIAKMNNGEVPASNPTPKPKPKPVNEETPAKNPNRYKNYSIPYKKIFSSGKGNSDEHPEWLEEKKEIINQILKSFGIDGEVVTYTKGPAFTRYEILLAPGVNVKKINQIYDNLQKDLQAESLRVLAPIPGKNTIGVEVPNDVADMVSYGDLVDESYLNNGKPLSVALGKNIDGSIVYQNITDMPHALIAGATQSGKSVSINTILISLLVKNSPEDLKLILVDPKRVELAFYNDIPHLATPVIDDAVIATEALKWSVAEMERRYDVLARNRVRNIGDYRKKRAENPMMENLPYIVIIVDEFNDLVMQCGAEANDCIIRLAQKARACGIHVILATQRPTVDVVNGTIKANITCRIAFRVASDVDSRTILDEVGAESLLGRGDMIIKNNGNPVRAQGAYISDDEINDVCSYLVDTYGEDYLFTHIDLKKNISSNSSSGGSHREAPSESEELLYQIALYCINSGMCSINSIQNQFQLGFNRASRIVQILEDREIVSPKNGTKGREILIDTYKLREIFQIDEE